MEVVDLDSAPVDRQAELQTGMGMYHGFTDEQKVIVQRALIKLGFEISDAGVTATSQVAPEPDQIFVGGQGTTYTRIVCKLMR